MCGINGIFAYHSTADPVDRTELTRTRDHMSARGPDSKGEWIAGDGRVGFGHRRLSIIDLTEAGAQPMASADGKLIVTFNGEIYNYRELRRRLEAQGRVFRSQSDTEVLLHLYAEKGAELVHDLRGMFAFAVWEVDRKRLFLARDPYGIKPLYYADDGRTLRFASQLKALLVGGALSRDPEPAGHVGFCLWGSVPEPVTTYRAIRVLPAGCSALVDQRGLNGPNRYHSIAAVYRNAEANGPRAPHASEAQARISEALLDSVRHHLVADVAVGAFLSAGIDSGALVGLMRDAGQSDVKTVTLRFEEFRGREDDEAPLAAEVARTYQTQHVTRIVTQREFSSDLPRILEAMDQPSIDGINTWFISKAARELGLKVAVSGLGGDELFGGYPAFRDMPRWVARLAAPSRIPFLGVGLRKMLCATGLGRMAGSPKTAGMVEYGGTYPGAYLLRRGLFMPWEIDQVLDRETARKGLEDLQPLAVVEAALTPQPNSEFAKVAVLEASLYMRNQLLRDADWASMAHSLEVRVPLVDAKLLEEVIALNGTEKATNAKMALATSPRVPLPAAVLHRAKTGFAVPTNAWIAALGRKAAGSPRVREQSKGLDARDWSKWVLAGNVS
jgi:asparagine synthase (glutamine-hydrolysing)